MKYSKKIILITILTLMMLPLFLIPRTAVAQEWTYDGVDTERIPDFSVYPSEWYIGNITGDPIHFPDENYTIFKIVKANLTDTFYDPIIDLQFPMGNNGTCVWVDLWVANATSGVEYCQHKNIQIAWWNESFYWSYVTPILPVEDDGKVSDHILKNATFYWYVHFMNEGTYYENIQTYPNIYSYAFWNVSNGAYLRANYTEDGILKKLEHYKCPIGSVPNMTLISEPAQESPEFSFTTETGSLTVNSTEFKLNISIVDADNNNDGDTDTDYLYRIQNGTEWSEWAAIPNLLDWNLGDVEEGSYNITIEVKNMYGVTQEDITIEYELPPKKKREIIPSYPIALISIVAMFSISIIIYKYRRKLRL